MSYVIEAFIAKANVLKKIPLDFKYPLVSLPFNMALIPLDEKLLESLGIKRLLLEHYQEIIVDKKSTPHPSKKLGGG